MISGNAGLIVTIEQQKSPLAEVSISKKCTISGNAGLIVTITIQRELPVISGNAGLIVAIEQRDSTGTKHRSVISKRE